MALTNAERQRAWRERNKGKPRGNKVLLDRLAALEAAVATTTPADKRATQRLSAAELAALRQERDALALQLAQVKAYAPKILAEARRWTEEN
jgi:hypothetical protein